MNIEFESEEERKKYKEEAKLFVLNSALELERITSDLLSILLKIDREKSLTLGNKGSALSFKSKVELLIDIGALHAPNKNKFIKFMEIRNQFLHNMDVTTFTECFSYCEGMETYLKRTYEKKLGFELDVESTNMRLFTYLVSDAIEIAGGVFAKIKEKRNVEYEGRKYKYICEAVRIQQEKLEANKIRPEAFINYVKRIMEQ